MRYEELFGAVVTPFDADDHLDLTTFDRIMSIYSDTHHRGVVVAGSTGEGESLSFKERKQLLECACAHPNLDIVMCLKGGSTAEVVREIKKYSGLSPFAFMVVVPPYYKAPDEGIYRHFHTIFKTFPGRCFFIYNIPSRTGSSLSLETYRRLTAECPNLHGLKDCSVNFDFVRKAAELGPLYGGSDDYALDYLKSGAVGFVSVASVFYPDSFHELFSAYQDGFHDLILYGYIRYVTNLLSLKTNPIGIKELFSLKSFPSMNLRLPLVPYDKSEREKLRKLLPVTEVNIEKNGGQM